MSEETKETKPSIPPTPRITIRGQQITTQDYRGLLAFTLVIIPFILAVIGLLQGLKIQEIVELVAAFLAPA